MALNPWLIGGLFMLLGGSALKSFERDAAREIASKLVGTGKRVSVSTSYPGLLSPGVGEVGKVTIRASRFRTEGLPFYTEPDRNKSGSVKELSLKLTDFYLRDLRCEAFTASIPDCRFDFDLAKSKRQIRLSRSGTGPGEVRILIRDLAPYILKKYPEIREVQVTPKGDSVRIQGEGLFLILNAKFDITARISTDGHSLSLVDSKVLIDGKSTDLASEKLLIETLNPVIHFERDLDLLDAVFAEKVMIRQNEIVVTGQVKIPEMPK